MKNRIAEIRESLGISKSALARAANTVPGQIRMLERGDRRLTVQWMERIAKALDVSPGDLIYESGSEDSQELDEEFVAQITEGVSRLYASRKSRLSTGDLGRLTARILNDIRRAGVSKDEAEGALKMALSQLDHEICTPSPDSDSRKRLA